MTDAAALWATNRVEAIEGTPASIARQFGVSWSTVWNAVARLARARVDDPDRVGPTAMVGFDETVMQPASRRRRRRFITAVVDVDSGQILDVFEGHDAQHLRAWMAAMPPAWLAQIEVVSVDPHEGYRSALVNPDPATGELSALVEATIVVDPFHMVRVRHEAPCVRRRVRDPPLRAVAAVR